MMIPDAMLLWLISLSIWELFWKGLGMWRAGRSNQFAWFVAMLVVNTAGILPITYLVFFQKKGNSRRGRR